MKKIIRAICAFLILAMLSPLFPTVSLFSSLSVSASNTVVRIGDAEAGGEYPNLYYAIYGGTVIKGAIPEDKLVGKTYTPLSSYEGVTFLFVSDVYEVNFTGLDPNVITFAKSCVIDGGGHTLSITKTYIVSGSGSADVPNVTFCNMTIVNRQRNTHVAISARANSNVTVENCVIDDSVCKAFALHSGGNCHLTVNSGRYSSFTSLFHCSYDNSAKSSVTVNGGYFEVAEGADAMFTLGGNVDVTVNGGVFVNKVGCPVFAESAQSKATSLDINGGAFYYSSAPSYKPFVCKNKSTMTANIAKEALFHGSLDNVSAASSAALTGVSPISVTPSAATADMYLSDGTLLSTSLSPALDEKGLDGALIILNGDSSAVIDFKNAALTLDKNGYSADGIKSSDGSAVIRDGVKGVSVYLQATESVVDTASEIGLRAVIALSSIPRSAGVLVSSDKTMANAEEILAHTCYGALIADGETVEAYRAKGRYLLIYDLSAVSGAELDKEIYLRFWADVGDGRQSSDTVAVKPSTVCELISEYAEHIDGVPYFKGGKNPSVYDSGDGYTMVLINDADEAEFRSYLSDLEKKGYELKFSNDANGDSLYRTFLRADGMMLHAYWTGYAREVRVTVAQDGKLPIDSPAVGSETYEPTFHMLSALKEVSLNNGAFKSSDGGLGFIVRLSDGRFIIYDGGNDTSSNGKDIYDYLKKAAPDPDNIVIATWYISHFHSDHYGAFKNFAERYASDSSITIESVMFNPWATADQKTQISVSGAATVYNLISKYYPTTPVYKPMTGQIYRFADTTIEIMFTMSDYMPKTIKYDDGNTQTMVAMLDVVSGKDLGDRIFLMGDTVALACDDMSARYGSYLKCDIVQVSHHGLASDSDDPEIYQRRLNSTKEIYTLLDPHIALWPTSIERYEDRMKYSVNRHLASIVDPDYTDGAEIYGDGVVSVNNFYIAEQNNFTVTFK